MFIQNAVCIFEKMYILMIIVKFTSNFDICHHTIQEKH